MKKFIASSLLVFPMMVAAQSFNVTTGDVTYIIPAAEAGDMVFNSGTTLNIAGKEFVLADVTGMAVKDNSLAANTVEVEFLGETAKVSVAGNIARYVDVTVSGAHVSIIQSAEVSADTCDEITYILKGESTNGGFYAEGSYKASYEFQGLNLTNPEGAAVDIQNGKRISISSKNGTENFLTDGASGSQKGALVVKGHLELKGKGSLTVKGNKSHGIYAKEYVTIKNVSVYIVGSVKDGLNCGQYFAMESGLLDITGAGDDGMQVSFKDDVDREPEDTGAFTMTGGKIKAASTAIAAKAIKVDGIFTISGGEITASAAGSGKWDATASKTKAASCISADGGIVIDGGKITLDASGGGGKGFNTDNTFTMNAGEIDITTTGGVFAYVSGTEYDNYTGNTDRLDSDAKSSPKGIKADGEVIFNGGTINVNTSGNGGEGIESKANLTINDGIFNIKSYDDAINSSGHMFINGGDITVISTKNDGLDANMNLYFKGGVVRAFGSSSPECGIDANEESGYSVIITGGTLLAAGGNNSTPSSSASTQPYLSLTNSLKAGNTVTIKNGSEVLATFEVPTNYNSSSSSSMGGMGGNRGGGLLISCPGLVSGTTYTVTYGSTSTTATAQTKGSSSGRPW